MSEQRMQEAQWHEELSAFMDGELAADRARFLQQRLSHDEELRARWERWQWLSATMRKQGQPVPAGFADRVARAIDAERFPMPAVRSSRWRWAGGAALAASFAIGAFMVFGPGNPVATPRPSPRVVALAPATIMPIQRTELPLPEPVVQLPIPVRSGVVTAFRSPAQTILVREPQKRPEFAPFPQPYAIDPELAAYLRSQKAGTTDDVFAQEPSDTGAVRTVAFPQDPQH